MENKNQNKFKLDDHKKKNLFMTPDRYFEELPQQIQKRISAENKNFGWFERFFLNPSFKIASAFSIVLLLGISIYFFQNKPEQAQETLPVFTSISEEETYDYIMENHLYSDPEIINVVENEFVESNLNYLGDSEEEMLEELDTEELEELIIEM
jgi:hypothetical protein